MVRTQILLDESTYKELKRLAYTNNKSMSAVVRELLSDALDPGGNKKDKKGRLKVSDFKFVGSFSSGKVDNVSERHDEVLGEEEW